MRVLKVFMASTLTSEMRDGKGWKKIEINA